MYVKQNENKM